MIPEDRRKGYFRLWRSFFESPIWQTAPESWGRVALVLLAKSNWKAGTLYDGTVVPPGSLVTSQDHLARDARCTRQQVRDAIAFLSRAKFLTSERTRKYTFIKITNWEAYQGQFDSEEPTEEPQKNQTGTTKEPDQNQPGTTIKESNQGIRESRNQKPTTDNLQTNLRSDSIAGAQAVCVRNGSQKNPTSDLRQRLEEYVSESEFFQGKKLSERMLGEIRAAAETGGGIPARDETIIGLLDNLWDEGYAPGTTKEPRTWTWFRKTIGDRFAQRRASAPQGYPPAATDRPDKLSQEEFDSMTDAIELPSDVPW